MQCITIYNNSGSEIEQKPTKMDYPSNEFFFEGSRIERIKLYFYVQKAQLFMYKTLYQSDKKYMYLFVIKWSKI